MAFVLVPMDAAKLVAEFPKQRLKSYMVNPDLEEMTRVQSTPGKGSPENLLEFSRPVAEPSSPQSGLVTITANPTNQGQPLNYKYEYWLIFVGLSGYPAYIADPREVPI